MTSVVRQKLSLILTLVAWLLATGSQWDLVQTFAWGRMIATYSESMSLASAVKKTFSADTMCPLCHAVARAQQESDQNPAVPNTKVPAKIPLVCAPSSLVFLSPTSMCVGLVSAVAAPLSAERDSPPSPPPRALA
jgi:hypothetical protein